MHRSDDSHDADVRLRDAGEVTNLAHVVHPHLQHDPLVLVRQVHQRQRQSNLVVVTGLALEHRVTARQDRRYQFLGRRLAHTARDTNDAHVVLPPPESRRLLERLEAIGHLEHQRKLRFEIWDLEFGIWVGQVQNQGLRRHVPLDDRRHRPPRETIGDVIVTIHALPPERNEQRARLNLPGIYHRRRHRLIQSRGPNPRQSLDHVRQRQPAHAHLATSATAMLSGGISRIGNNLVASLWNANAAV